MAGRSAINDFLGGGAGPIPNGSPGAGGLVAFPFEAFETPLLDLTMAQLGIELVPARPGYIAVVAGSAFWIAEQISGTQTSACSAQAGSNAAHTNTFPSAATPTNGDVAAAASILPAIVVGPIAQSTIVGVQRFANAPIILDITVGAAGTGGFALKARLHVRVTWVAV